MATIKPHSDLVTCNNLVTIDSDLIQGFLLQYLRNKYSDYRNCQYNGLRDEMFQYAEIDHANENIDKGMIIDMAYRYDTTAANNRPGIYLVREVDELGHKLAWGDRYQTPTFKLGEVNANEQATLGVDSFVYAMAGVLSIHCVGRNPYDAELLGKETWISLISSMYDIRRFLRLDELRTSNLSKLNKVAEFDDNWATTILVRYKYQKVIDKIPLTPLLQGFDVKTSGDA